MGQRTKPNDKGKNSKSNNDVDPHAYILQPQIFVHPIGSPMKQVSVCLHPIGFIGHVVDSFAALLRSLDVLPHDVDGIVDLLMEPLY